MIIDETIKDAKAKGAATVKDLKNILANFEDDAIVCITANDKGDVDYIEPEHFSGLYQGGEFVELYPMQGNYEL